MIIAPNHFLPRFLLVFVLASLPVLQAQNDAVEESFQVAIAFIKRGIHDDAAKQLEALLAEAPKHRLANEARYRLGVCKLELNKKKEAAAAFAAALRGGGAFRLAAECRYRLGNTLRELGDLAGASQQYARLVRSAGLAHYLAVPSLYAQGECLRDLGKFTPALSAFESAARSDTDKLGKFGLPALYQKGFILLKLERYRDAQRSFALAATRYPKNVAAAECRYLEGEAAYRSGDYQQAQKAYQSTIASGGDFADDAWYGLAWTRLKSGDEKRALALFSSLPERFPASDLIARSRVEVGRIHQKSGRSREAIVVLDGFLGNKKADPKLLVDALEIKGLASLDLGRPKDAVKAFEAALASLGHLSNRSRLEYELGEARSDDANWNAALTAYSRAEKTAGADVRLLGDVLYGQCFVLHKLADYEGSIAKAQALLKRAPKHRLGVRARFAIAENYYALQQYGEADGYYAQIPEQNELVDKAEFKRAWCAYLAKSKTMAADRFARLAEKGSALAEESLAMAALAWLDVGKSKKALALADRYRARYRKGRFLARTERVASRVLKKDGDFKAAADRLAMAASVEKLASKAALDRLETAELEFQKGDYKRARTRYLALTEHKDKTGFRALEGLAWCAFELEEDKACLDWARKAIVHKEAREGRASLLELISSVEQRAGNWSGAQKAAHAFLAEFPRHERAADMRYALGIAQSRAARFGDARSTFEQLVREDSFAMQDRVQYELAWVCKKMGDDKAALVAFGKVNELSKDTELVGEALLHLGVDLLDRKKLMPAREMLAKVKGKHRARALYRLGFSWLDEKLAPGLSEGLSKSLAKGGARKALPFFEAIVKIGKKTTLYEEALFLVGECLYRASDMKSAALRFSRFLAAAPTHDRSQTARLHYGHCALSLKDADSAATVLVEYLGRHDDATARKKDVDLARARLWLGKARQLRKEYVKAETSFKLATQHSDGAIAAEAQFRIGECRRDRGELDEAVGAFVKLTVLYAQDEWVPRGLFETARCYEGLKEPKKAEKFYQELVQRYAGSKLAELAKKRLRRLRKI